jgi:signal transduction histidine kinase
VQAPFDLVLLDIMMPQMDGLQVLQHIRSNPKTADLPVILISALAEGQQIARGLECGANDYVTKPIDMDVTLARVQTQIALKQLQDERKQTIAELKAVHEMKDRLLRMASHDLKGPLTNIRLATLLLKGASECVPDGAELLEAVEASVETMQNVIEDFLDNAAAQTGTLDMHFECLDLDLLVEEVLAEHKVNAVRKNITLQTRDITGKIYADLARFRQVLSNLVSNAVKYTLPDTQVTLWAEWTKTHATIYVADQGEGIPANEQDKLFTQFGKLTPRPTGGESSTGLGLWIVKHLVTLQNGEVGFIAPPEGGSTFWIKIPAV